MHQKAHIFEDISVVPAGMFNEPLVFTNGCFDVLHFGHVKYLEASRALGQKLVVGLNSDHSVKRLKGDNRPRFQWQERAEVLAMLRCVDCVIGFDEDTPIELIKMLRPVVITKGGDYKRSEMIGKSFVESYGGSVHIMPYYEGFSSTRLIRDLEG